MKGVLVVVENLLQWIDDYNKGRSFMQTNQTKYLTYGAMMVVLFAILLAISFYMPLVGFITSLILPLPLAWYSVKFELKQSIMVMIIGIVISFIIGGIFGFISGLLVAPLGFIIGYSLRNKKSKLYILMASSIFILLMSAVQYIISILLMNINVIEQLLEGIKISHEQAGNIMSSMDRLPQNYDERVKQTLLSIETMMPAYFIGGAFIAAFIYVTVNLFLLKRLKLEVPKFLNFIDFRLPKAVLWYYLIVSILTLFVTYEIGSFGYIASVNALLILRTLLFIQGVSLIHYYFNVQGYPKWTAVFASLLAIPLFTFTIILGVFDLGFNMRNFLRDRYKK